MAGYPLGALAPVIVSYFGGNGKHFFLDDVACKGTEESIFDCGHRGLGKHNCGTREWAGVICNNGTQPPG